MLPAAGRGRSARMQAKRAAFAKVLVERPGCAKLGAHVLGHQAGEIIQLFAFANDEPRRCGRPAPDGLRLPDHGDIRHML